jgi:hypothetical protein
MSPDRYSAYRAARKKTDEANRGHSMLSGRAAGIKDREGESKPRR